MAYIDLYGALNIGKLDAGYASNIESQRFLNPEETVCYTWNGQDYYGRPVCEQSYYTKASGCNMAEDRIKVENSIHRPSYSEYASLNMSGLTGQPTKNAANAYLSLNAIQNLQNTKIATGYTGNDIQDRLRADPLPFDQSKNWNQGGVPISSVANRQMDRAKQGYMQNKLGRVVGI